MIGDYDRFAQCAFINRHPLHSFNISARWYGIPLEPPKLIPGYVTEAVVCLDVDSIHVIQVTVLK